MLYRNGTIHFSAYCYYSPGTGVIIIVFNSAPGIFCYFKDTRWLHASDVVPVDVDKQHSNNSHDDPSC